MDTTKTPGATGPPPGPRSPSAPLIERAPLPSLEVQGSAHTVMHANAAFCRLLGKTRAELVGRPFAEIVPAGDECVALLDSVYQTGEAATHAHADDSDSAYWLYAMWPALDANESPVGVIIQLAKSVRFEENAAAANAALLIAGLRQHELNEEAKNLNAQMLKEIAERKTAETALRAAFIELESAHLVAKRANLAKDRFLAALSHELRTPLTPVLMAAATLRADERLPGEAREQLAMMERNIGLEARLIDDLLDVTKISQGKLQFRVEACDAHHLIARSLEIVQEDARAKEIALERDFAAPNSRLMADPARFQQVIWNLLRNAVKFTPPKGRITIRTRQGEGIAPEESWLRIEIADSGRGIEATRLEQIFEPFDQGGLTGDHRFGGVGLGLAIARAVVALHGGRIHAESLGPDRGATFVVLLPAGDAPRCGVADTSSPLPPGATAVPSRTVAPLRFLLVEDHENTLQTLTRLLEGDGHYVIAATNVAAGLAAAAAATPPFDFVISDLGLPDGSGLELMEKLRARGAVRGIALSGYGTEADIARSRAAGFATHLVKPVSIAVLRRVIATLSSPVK